MAAYMDNQSALAAWRSGLKFEGDTVSSSKYAIFPGFCDVHVHFREPGFLLKETILTGSQSAAAGGYTAVCTMPNLNPVPDSPEHLQIQLDAIRKDLETRFADTPMILRTAYTGDPSVGKVWNAQVQEQFPEYRVTGDPLPISIACHVGPGVIALGLMKKI